VGGSRNFIYISVSLTLNILSVRSSPVGVGEWEGEGEGLGDIMRKSLMVVVRKQEVMYKFLFGTCTSLYKLKSLKSDQINQLGLDFSKFNVFVVNQWQQVCHHHISSANPGKCHSTIVSYR
jgi:hypothetical protein